MFGSVLVMPQVQKAAEISASSSGKINKYGYFTGEEILPSSQRHIIEQAKFAYRKPFEKQTEKEVGALNFLNLSNKKVELKQTEGILPQNLMNDLIHDKLKKIINLQDVMIYTINENIKDFMIFYLLFF